VLKLDFGLDARLAGFERHVGAGGFAAIGSRAVIFSKPLITASSEPSTCSARPSVATVRFFTRPVSSR
jgi:hypothetical protein